MLLFSDLNSCATGTSPRHLDPPPPRKTLFKWSRQRDILWLNKSDIIFKVDEPVPTGKTKRMYTFLLKQCLNWLVLKQTTS